MEKNVMIDHVYSLDYPGDPYSLRVVKDFPGGTSGYLVLRYKDKVTQTSEVEEFEDRTMILSRDGNNMVWVPLIGGLPSRFMPEGMKPFVIERVRAAHAYVQDFDVRENARSEEWWEEHHPGYVAVLTGEGECCEGCPALATLHDVEGVPLCEHCAALCEVEDQ